MIVTFCDICGIKIEVEQDMIVQICDLEPGEGSKTISKHSHQHFHHECMKKAINQVQNTQESVKGKQSTQ